MTVYDRDELPRKVKSLLNAADEARLNAYAPYSDFLVGCAILLENGEVVIGNNQENAAYPSGLCAERVAIFHARATYPDQKIKMMALTAGPRSRDQQEAVPPCGACRQVMAEFENNQQRDIPVYFSGTVGTVIQARSVKDLLPLIFDQRFL